jgi:hypothetical protein
MIKVITVEREYGSRGGEFAHHLAGSLGWRLIDQCLIDEIAEKAGIARTLAEDCDERLDPWYYRFGKTFWHSSIEPLPGLVGADVFDSERMVEFVREYMQEVAAKGAAVIIGRGAASILARAPHAFHVFVYASQWRKIKWYEEQFPDEAKHDAKATEEQLAAVDRRRAAYIRRYHEQEWTDRRLYHLMMNSCMGFDAMVSATLEAAGLPAARAVSPAVSS